MGKKKHKKPAPKPAKKAAKKAAKKPAKKPAKKAITKPKAKPVEEPEEEGIVIVERDEYIIAEEEVGGESEELPGEDFEEDNGNRL